MGTGNTKYQKETPIGGRPNGRERKTAMQLCSNERPETNGKKSKFIVYHRHYFQPKKKQTWIDKRGNKHTTEDYPYNCHQGISWTAGKWGYLIKADSEREVFVANDTLSGHPAYIGRILKLDEVVTGQQARDIAAKIKSGLKKAGLPYWSCLEVNEENTFHWNILVRCPDTLENTKQLIKVLRQSSGDVRCRIEKFRTKITNIAGLVAYCLKCKVADKEGHKDRWQAKRVLFAKGTGLHKVDSSADFFVVPKGKIRAAIKEAGNVEGATQSLVPFTISEGNVINPIPTPSQVKQIDGDGYTIFIPVERGN